MQNDKYKCVKVFTFNYGCDGTYIQDTKYAIRHFGKTKWKDKICIYVIKYRMAINQKPIMQCVIVGRYN